MDNEERQRREPHSLKDIFGYTIDGIPDELYACGCPSCGNVFWTRADTREWLPRYCCYCSAEFIAHETITKNQVLDEDNDK